MFLLEKLVGNPNFSMISLKMAETLIVEVWHSQARRLSRDSPKLKFLKMSFSKLNKHPTVGFLMFLHILFVTLHKAFEQCAPEVDF